MFVSLMCVHVCGCVCVCVCVHVFMDTVINKWPYSKKLLIVIYVSYPRTMMLMVHSMISRIVGGL